MEASSLAPSRTGFWRRVHRSAAAWAFLSTLLRLGANVVVLPLMLHKLPAEHLGLWYVFGALGGLATLMDFGFEGTVARMTAYAWGGATRFASFGFHGEPFNDQPNRILLRRLIATLQAYYRSVGIIVLLLLAGGGGWWIWHKTTGLAQPQSIRLAWLVFAFGNCLNFIGGRWPAFLTGIGELKLASQIGLAGIFVYYALALTGLLAGWGIWALVIATVAMGIAIRGLGRLVFVQYAQLSDGIPKAHFHRDIFASLWPNAWRLGLVSLGAFLIVQANTLICSAFLGLAVTASYGLSFQVITILSGVSAIWVQVKIPEINQLRVRGENERIARLFISRIRLTILTFWLGAIPLIFLGPTVLSLIGSKTGLLPTGLLTLFCLIQFLEMHHTQYSSLVLSENHNPFLKPALLSGLAVILSSSLLAPRFGVLGMLLATGIVQATYNNWWPVIRAIRGIDMSVASYTGMLTRL